MSRQWTLMRALGWLYGTELTLPYAGTGTLLTPGFAVVHVYLYNSSAIYKYLYIGVLWSFLVAHQHMYESQNRPCV